MNAADLEKLKAMHPIGPGVLALNAPLLEVTPERLQTSYDPLREYGGDKLNKTERDYLAWLLNSRDMTHDRWIGVQNITLKLGEDCRLTMDFSAVDENGLRLIDTKGTNRKTGKPRIEDDALVKMRAAARMFPWIRFVVAWKVDGLWRHKEITP